ncbi:hypothetical protein STIAU_2995 [Stigmatella aurantiaca DW4/3-1]|uniref:Uncharacterized protein n=1 Tax=Stigmatella aurantiaca (strain DW4/3-1) TaxID=378806 RepID=Q09D90_STIAD|nr:hypothetical protein STIAU_2995 [Stigmatella aurantiaca DW4/3-1]
MLPWHSMDEVLKVARAFLEPVLRGERGTWTKGARSWSTVA